MKLVSSGNSAKEVPIDFRPRRAGEPKYETSDLLDNIKLFVKLFFQRYEKPIKFGLVGATGTIVNMGLLYLLTEEIGFYYLVSSAIAIETSIVSNFVLNELWTFVEKGKKGSKNLLKRFFKFNSISAVGLGINLGILAMLTEFAGFHYLVSNFFAIMIVFIWNYLANVTWTWNE